MLHIHHARNSIRTRDLRVRTGALIHDDRVALVRPIGHDTPRAQRNRQRLRPFVGGRRGCHIRRHRKALRDAARDECEAVRTKVCCNLRNECVRQLIVLKRVTILTM